MKVPVLQGVIDRRILINYRVDPAVARRLLPAPFRPRLVEGAALGGVCLIRLVELRPRGMPAMIGLSSEGAAHRFAVEWDGPEGPRQGVYIPRRHTSSCAIRLVGGRLFPGAHDRAHFEVDEREGDYRVAVTCSDGSSLVQIAAREAQEIHAGSVFRSIEEARAFFEEGCVGCSDTARAGELDAMELRCTDFRVSALEVEWVSSSFFDDQGQFPAGSVAFDSALLMRHIVHEWHDRGRVRAAPGASSARHACSLSG